jgi:branched-subunit amino acid ABC-type transport system permease component
MLIDLVQNSLDGLMIGSSYALLALGFTLIFGVLRRLNLSYGPAIMLGAYGATWTSLHFQAGAVLLAAITIGGAALAGVYVERLCFARAPSLGRSTAIASMVASFALWMQFEELVTLVLPKHLYAFPPLYTGDALRVGPFTARVEYLVMLASALAICFALYGLLYRTRFGLGVRAVIDSIDGARCIGVNVPSVLARVFALASAIGGVAGYLIVATSEQVTPMLGMWSTLKGMIAMMLGGLGSLPGAVAGGLLLGLIEIHSQWYVGPAYRDLIAYAILFLCLWLRPEGLFVRGVARRRLIARA